MITDRALRRARGGCLVARWAGGGDVEGSNPKHATVYAQAKCGDGGRFGRGGEDGGQKVPVAGEADSAAVTHAERGRGGTV